MRAGWRVPKVTVPVAADPGRRRAAVIGGGIAGLSAAYEFHRAGWAVDVYEASGRWGGKILTSPVGDGPDALLVDAGPDAVLMRAEAGRELVAELGLTDEMTHPVAPKPAYLFLDGRLHVLPAGTVLGVPVDPVALDHTELISDAGRERAALDLEMPPSDLSADVTIGALCRERLGDELTDRLIDPLVGGINASNIDRLSLRAAAPLLAQAMTDHGSLIRGLGKMYPQIGAALGGDRAEPGGPGGRPAPRPPVFFSLTGGVARIVDRLIEELPAQGLHLNHPVGAVDEVPGSADIDAIVIATPAPAAARLLAAVPTAADHLSRIPYATVSQATVVIPGQPPLDAAGVLFPRVGGTMLTASTWLSSKWSHYHDHDAAAADRALIRLTSGRYGDERTAALDEETLASTLLGELDRAVPLVAEPTAVRIQRWPRALPQYEVGHLDRVAEIRDAVQGADPRIRLAGAAYDGIGIPACIAGGRNAARDLLQ